MSGAFAPLRDQGEHILDVALPITSDITLRLSPEREHVEQIDHIDEAIAIEIRRA